MKYILKDNRAVISYCIDWFKIKIGFQYDLNNPERLKYNIDYFRYEDLNYESKCRIDNVFNILKLELNMGDEVVHSNSWGRIISYGSLKLYLDPTDYMIDKKRGKQYLFIELSGEACREFERRGGKFEDLYEYISLDKNCEFYRNDIAIDLFSDCFFTQKELIKKIVNKEYISTLKSPKDMFQADVVGIINNEWSFTWGAHNGNQFVIYNKSAERAKKLRDKSLLGKYWIRFEIRNVGDSVKLLGRQIAKAISENKLNDFVSSLLLKKMKFIEKIANNKSRDSLIWKNWEEFIAVIGNPYDISMSVKGINSDMPTTIYRWYNWLRNNVRLTLQKLYLISPNSFISLINRVTKLSPKEKVPDIKSSELRLINECRCTLGEKVLNRDDLENLLRLRLEENSEIDTSKFINALDSYSSRFEEVKENQKDIKERVFASLEDDLLPF